VLFRLPGDNPHPSEVRARGQVTMKGQAQLELSTALYWRNGEHALKAKVSHRGTAERFYGIGPDTPESNEETYRPRRQLAYVEGLHSLLPSFRAGVRLEFEFFEFVDRYPGGALQAPEYSSQRREVVGTGIALEWDRRDRRYAPTRGYYLDLRPAVR
jgi:hypothetical protein